MDQDDLRAAKRVAQHPSFAGVDDPPVFVVTVSRIKLLAVCVLWTMMSGLLLAPVMLAQLPMTITLLLAAIGIGMFAVGVFAAISIALRPRSSLVMDRAGWRHDGCMGEPMPWEQVVSHQHLRDGQSKMATIRVMLATPHTAQSRFRPNGKLAMPCYETGRQSVVLGVSFYDRPPRLIRAAFHAHLEASRRRRRFSPMGG